MSLFRVAPSSLLAVRAVRLSPEGVASIVAVPTDSVTSKLSFCCVLVGLDCHSGLASCCYCLDEAVDGALFDAKRELVVVWTRQQASVCEGGALAFHVFQVSDAVCSTVVRRFRVECQPGQHLQRIEWSGDRLVLWLGALDEHCSLFVASVRSATGSARVAASAPPPMELDASGLGRQWEYFTPLFTPPVTLPISTSASTRTPCNLNECTLSRDAAWALFRDSAGAPWQCLHLRGKSGATPQPLMAHTIAACFALRRPARPCEIFALLRGPATNEVASPASLAATCTSIASSDARDDG